jgi:hypothetical protein
MKSGSGKVEPLNDGEYPHGTHRTSISVGERGWKRGVPSLIAWSDATQLQRSSEI